MWFYLWPHTVYHLMRWFPRNNRVKARVVVILFTLALLVPQFVILFQPHTGRYCGGHLLELLITGVVLSFLMAGFSIIFSIMDPVANQIKIAFHVSGVINLLYLVSCTVLFFTKSADCLVNTQELYYYSLAMLTLSLVAAALLLVTIPFWIANSLHKDNILNMKQRDGVCYEPVRCCQCIWHI
ncbi:uncharacterized protein LOC135497110 [Lineus longissimus]|uniref:uncharacterized protein LOC135497110 n=1 Tax=Lineus longissimus TaxID=88925 RepID=UPI002B4C2E03